MNRQTQEQEDIHNSLLDINDADKIQTSRIVVLEVRVKNIKSSGYL